MHLNTITPAPGATKVRKRVGRGMGSGTGKTCGRGHKGQKSRSGGFNKRGFEGGQQPLQRRLPKVGFTSRKSAKTAEVRLDTIAKIEKDMIDLSTLKDAGAIPANTLRAKIVASGDIDRPVTIKGVVVTAGAQKVIEAVGGKIEE